jgi:hypothetical protein
VDKAGGNCLQVAVNVGEQGQLHRDREPQARASAEDTSGGKGPFSRRTKMNALE